eukprot:2872687-Rhodomonas_salina.1
MCASSVILACVISLVLTSTTLSGDGTEGIDSLKLFVDHTLGLEVDEFYWADPCRKADGAVLLEGSSYFIMVYFAHIPSVELHAVFNSTHVSHGELNSSHHGNGTQQFGAPPGFTRFEFTFEVDFAAGEYVFQVFAKTGRSDVFLKESGRFLVMKSNIPQSVEEGMLDAQDIGCAHISSPVHQDLVQLGSEQDCVPVIAALQSCSPVGVHRMLVVVNGISQSAVLSGPNAPAVCVSGFKAGLNNVFVQLYELEYGGPRDQVISAHSFRVHVTMGSWRHSSSGASESGRGDRTPRHEPPLSMAQQFQDLMRASLFGAAASLHSDPGDSDHSDEGLEPKPKENFVDDDSEYFVSLVLTGSTHEYGNDFLARLQTSVDLFRSFAIIEDVRAEVLVVDYNPVVENRTLSDLLQRRAEHDAVPLRVVSVPRSAHEHVISHFRTEDAQSRPPTPACEENLWWRESAADELGCKAWTAHRCHEFLKLAVNQWLNWLTRCKTTESCTGFPTEECCSCQHLRGTNARPRGEPALLSPVFPGVANNIGARRSKGKFLLFANADIIFSKNIFMWLHEGQVREDVFYRVDGRVELLRDEAYAPSWQRQRDRVSALTQALDKCEGTLHTLPLSNGAGDFLLLSRKALWAVNAFPELPLGVHAESYMLLRLFDRGYPQMLLRHGVAFHQSQPATWRFSREFELA